MSERSAGERVCSRSPGYYYRIPGTIRRGTTTIDGTPAYVVELDSGRTVTMPSSILDTPTDDDVDAFHAKQERDAYEAERLAKLERQRRRDEQERKQAEARKQNARVYGLESLKR